MMISNGRSVAIDFGLIYTKANEILLTSSVIEVFPFKMSAFVKEQSDIRLCTYRKEKKEMMNYLNFSICPYKGIDDITFGAKLDEIKDRLKKEKIPYTQSIDPNKGCVPEVPWIFVMIENSITLCFVHGILFEIVLENKFKGKLSNGGYIGMSLTELEALDSSLEYNDDEEDYESEKGYWITDDIESGKVTSITVFVPEVLEEDFFEYKWIERYL